MRDIDGVLNVESETEPDKMKTIVTYDDAKTSIEKIKKVLGNVDVPFMIEQ
ncbi:MAG: hypothetical protein QMD01_02985 [Thermodesulfovibrionales bacterium]|nr:hypothetical protein [Thermodesulfovibrionales bacterium]